MKDNFDSCLSAKIKPCFCKAFDSCPYKEVDDDLCEICISDAILYLKRRLRSLKRQRKGFKFDDEQDN